MKGSSSASWIGGEGRFLKVVRGEVFVGDLRASSIAAVIAVLSSSTILRGCVGLGGEPLVIADKADSARSLVCRLDMEASLFRSAAVRVLSAVDPAGDGTDDAPALPKKLPVRNLSGDTGREASGEMGREEVRAGGA